MAAACAATVAEAPIDTVDVAGYVHAGPVCPVAQVPPDPACDDRPVVGAELLVLDSVGEVVAEIITDSEGAFIVALPPGEYLLVPQPVAGLMGTAEPTPFRAAATTPFLDVAYDTGIR